MKSFKGKGIALIAILLVVLSFSYREGFPAGKENNTGTYSINRQAGDQSDDLREAVIVHDGLISLDISDVPLSSLLKIIADKTDIGLTIGADIKGTLSLKLTDATLEDVLKQICNNRALVYQYSTEDKTYRILSAAVYESGKTSGEPAPRGKDGSPSPPSTPFLPIDGERRPTSSDSPEEQHLDSQGRPLYKARELLVKFKKGVARAQMDELHRGLGSIVLKTIEKSSLQRIKLKEGLSEREAVALYAAYGIVSFAERHALRYPCETLPDDPFFGQQWGLHNTGQPVNGTNGGTVMGTIDKDIDAPEAWDVSKGGKEVLIAVIDSGVDYNHPDLQSKIWVNPGEAAASGTLISPGGVATNGIDDDQNGYIDDFRGWDFAGTSWFQSIPDNDPMDRYGHGTHVAGIIAAVRNNGIGVAGVFAKARIMTLKVQSDDDVAMETYNIVDAIGYARAQGTRIVNCSLGGESSSRSEYEAFQELRDAGILAVCAAGNDGLNMDSSPYKTYPAYYGHSTDSAYPPLDNIISVAAGDQYDNLASFSNYGGGTVDVMAPGTNIYSTCLNTTYCFKEGTSMAAPFVTGIAGLLLSLKPALTYGEVKAVIFNNLDLLPSLAGSLIYGGRVNAYKALSGIHTPGDLTGDNLVGLDDLILSLRILSGYTPPGSSYLLADVNNDSRIGMEEAIFILQTLAALRGNNPPVLASIGGKSVPAGKQLTFTIWATDADSDNLTYSASGMPAGAVFNAATRTFTWTPGLSQAAVYSVTFRVEDGHGNSDSETVTITVTDTQPTFAVADYYPLNSGDWWDYKVNGTETIRRSAVTGIRDINGVSTTIIEDYDGRKGYYTVDGEGLKLHGQYEINDSYTGDIIFTAPLLLLKNNAGIGEATSSTTQFPLYSVNIVLTSLTTILGLEDVTTESKTLKDCIKISSLINQRVNETGAIFNGDIGYHWFCSGIGSVKDFLGSDLYMLHRAQINGAATDY